MEGLGDFPISPLTPSTKIYKDQCVLCFDTPLHGPLYVDFQKYWAYCSLHISKVITVIVDWLRSSHVV